MTLVDARTWINIHQLHYVSSTQIDSPPDDVCHAIETRYLLKCAWVMLDVRQTEDEKEKVRLMG